MIKRCQTPFGLKVSDTHFQKITKKQLRNKKGADPLGLTYPIVGRNNSAGRNLQFRPYFHAKQKGSDLKIRPLYY